jgi:hypothetical protein
MKQNALEARKNFPLYLNKQTAILRDTYGKDNSLRELFTKHSKDQPVVIFPTSGRTVAIPKSQKDFQLDEGDPIMQKVVEYLEEQVPKDYIYAQTDAITKEK